MCQALYAGSLLRVPVYTMPFSRDVQPSIARVRRLQQLLARCVAAGGCICVAREHNASLMNKKQARHAVLTATQLCCARVLQ